MPDLAPPSKDPASFAQPQGRPLEQPPVPEMTPEQADALLKDLAVPGEPDQPTAEGLPVPELEPEPEAPAEAAPGEGEPPAPGTRLAVRVAAFEPERERLGLQVEGQPEAMK